MAADIPAGCRPLIERLDRAIELSGSRAVTERVKRDLETLIAAGELRLPDRFRQPRADCYARRLLYRHPSCAYTAVVMAWAPGQRTALHDHAGIWCVEGVVEGVMEVARFECVENDGETWAFEPRGIVRAGVGSAGCLVPPFEYHVLANALDDRSSITLHVYGGEMTRCHVFEPRGGGRFARVERALAYHD